MLQSTRSRSIDRTMALVVLFIERAHVDRGKHGCLALFRLALAITKRIVGQGLDNKHFSRHVLARLERQGNELGLV